MTEELLPGNEQKIVFNYLHLSPELPGGFSYILSKNVYYLGHIHFIVPSLQRLSDNLRYPLKQISIPIPYVIHGRTGAIRKISLLLVSTYPPALSFGATQNN